MALGLLGGIEWYSVPEDPSRRWGYRAGFDAGVRIRGHGLALRELVVQLRGGPLWRLTPRDDRANLYTLGVELTVGMGAALDDPPSPAPALVTGLAITLGFTDVHRFHM